MRNAAVLVLIGVAAQVNGLFLDHVPLWRQALFLAIGVLAYLHGRHRACPREWTILGSLALPGAVAAVAEFSVGSGVLLSYALTCALPWWVGRFRRQQSELLAATAQRVRQLELEQRLVAERAELRERTRIAADIHDSVGHDLALIALRAGALELAGELPETHRRAAAELRASATTATDRLRSTIGVLRAEDAGGPAVEDVTTVVERARAAGMTVTTHGVGTTPLPPPIERALAHLVRESLTNAARHAPGAGVVVRVTREDAYVVVTVENPLGDDAGSTSARAIGHRPTPGVGLAGLRERVGLLAGSFHAAREHDRFVVTARFPVPAAAR
ncbi:sensor histidine kinase [Nocardia asteroides]|uniref:sensor histidine kinase n=1 Tax=Nocardia asteroides TaxID=1824 RepID=UPI001E58DCD4|nr:histidine kinase [Nocardia asteroides]UGT54747.1 histidine kinase [Nocardia asteroides]